MTQANAPRLRRFFHHHQGVVITVFSTTENAAVAAVELSDAERQPCEVWTRVMGYHRPVASFNVGKQGEHHERQFFAEPGRACPARG